jgi:predicted N-acetyltransferase YhbS
MSFQIRPERAQDAPLIDPLLDRTFGPDRAARTVYRLREGTAPVPGLCFAAVDEHGVMQASLRFWPVRIEETAAILLGPLAVEPALQGRGLGRALVGHGLAEARRLGCRICVVVGEPEYYGPYGFTNAPARGLSLPGPVDPRRFQVAELAPGALDGVSGTVARAAAPAEADRAGRND